VARRRLSRGLGKLDSVFGVGGLCVRWLPHDWVSVGFTVGVARCALTRCELQRVAAGVLRACNGLVEWRRAWSHCGCELPETPATTAARNDGCNVARATVLSTAATAVTTTNKLKLTIEG
jgi:hypothetical protein